MRPLKWILLTTLILLQTACGFHPIYGSQGDAPATYAQLNQIAIDNMPDRIGQILRNDLIDRLYGKMGRPAHPLYTLTIKIRSTEEDLGIQADATSTRTLMNMFGDFVLKDAKDKEIMHGTAHSVASFVKLADQYATLAARYDAQQRTLHEVSEEIVNSLSLHFAEEPATITP